MIQSQCKLGMRWWQTLVDASETVADMKTLLYSWQIFTCHYTIIALLSLNCGNACSWYAFYLNIFFIINDYTYQVYILSIVILLFMTYNTLLSISTCTLGKNEQFFMRMVNYQTITLYLL